MDEFNLNINNPQAAEPAAVPTAEAFPTETAPLAQNEFVTPHTDIPPQTEPYIQPVNNQPPIEDTPVWNKVEYSPIEPVKSYAPMSKGLKVFCAVLLAAALLTASCATGYLIGQKSTKASGYIGSSVDVDLAARPKDQDPNTPAELYQKLNESVVGIRVYNDAGQAGDASGVIYSKDGFIVTNDHIYAEIGNPKFKIYMHDGTEYSAAYVAGDTVSDLAVLKIESKNKFKPAQFGDSETLINGETVVAIGRPSDATDSSSITTGVISLTRRRVKSNTTSYSARLIQTDSAINPGSSGGALVNAYGQVIGITSSKLAGAEYDAIGFAIPTKTMKRVVEQLIKDGKVTDRAKLGITYTEINSVTAEIKNYASVGLYVVSVGEDSDMYGKIGEGDIITHVNGIEITNDEVILDVIEDSKAGDTIVLKVLLSKGDEVEYKVKLRANISDSSYTDKISDRELPDELKPQEEPEEDDKENSKDGGKFNFPFGE